METLKTQAKELLLSPDLLSLVSLVTRMIGTHEDPHKLEAKAIFAHCSQNYPNTLSLKLTHLLQSSNQSPLTAAYATFLSSLLTGHSHKISPMILTELKPLLFACFQRQTLEPILKPLAVSIGIVALRVSKTKHADWQELLDYIVSSADSEDQKYRELGLILFSELPMKMGRFLMPTFDSLYLTILKCFSSPTMNHRSFGFRMSLILVVHLEGFVDYDSVKDLLPTMLKFLIELMNDRQDASIELCLKNLNSLVKENAKFFTKHLKHVCETMLQIAEADYVGEKIRYAAMDIVRALNDSLNTEMFALMQNLTGENLHRLISASMDMLVRIKDDPILYNMDFNVTFEDINGGQMESYDLGSFLLDQISAAVAGDVCLPITLKLTQQYLAAPEWQKHHAAMATLSIVAEECSEEMINSLEQVATMISNSLQDLHPRVRLAAVHAVRMLSVDLAPTLQAQYHHKMLPALNAVLTEDFQFPLLQAHAALAIRFFSMGCRPNDLTPHLEEIVSKLLALLQNENQHLQEGAVSTLASVAIFSQDQFHICYDVTMASLKSVFFNETDASKLLLRAKSAECISYLAMVVGEKKFMNDATKVIEVLVSLQQSLSNTDYSIRIHLLQAWMGLCKCLGDNFVTYITDLMPILLRSADLSIGINTQDDRSDILKEKALACNLLCLCARQLKENFFTWVNQVAKILVPLLEFHPHFETQTASVSAMPDLLCSAMLAIQKGESGGHSMSYVQHLVILIIPALVKALKKEPEKEICARMLNSLNKCVEVSGLVFTKAQIKLVAYGMKHVLAVHSFRNLKKAERQAGEDFDMEEENNRKKQLEDILHQAGNCLITTIKVFKAKFVPYFEKISSVITAMLGNHRTAREKTIAFSIANCVIQHCHEAAHKYFDSYLPLLLKACDDENYDVKQEAANGIGVCAEYAQSNFKTIAEAAVVSLNSVIRHSDALSSENRKAYDIAVSALGKICKFHRESINAPEVVPTWLSYLPIKDDSTEAKVVHEQLCSMVERSDKELLGPDNLHLPKIIEVFTKVVAERDNLATAETADRMVALLMQFEKLL